MESKVDVQAIREQYLQTLCSTGVDESVVNWLDSNGFFEAPATTKYHHSYPGGLALHSIEVANILTALAKTFGIKVEDKVLIRLGLLHDISKADYYELTSINKKVYSPDGSKWDDLGNFDWVSEVGYKVKDIENRDNKGNFGFASMCIALNNNTKLTEEEMIALSNYQYITQPTDAVETLSLSSSHKLTLLLHMADMASSYLIH